MNNTQGQALDIDTKHRPHRCGYIALVGKPNVGKSTLLNALLDQKLSIVSRKPQTTRRRVLGILSDEDYQIIFLDTPGIIDARYGLHRAMMSDLHASVRDSDMLVFLTDATTGAVDTHSLDVLPEMPSILALNKMDLVKQDDLLPLVDAYTKVSRFEDVIPISALKRKNLDVLLNSILDRLPESPPLYPTEMISEQPERFFIAEIIREQIFHQFRKEIPYSVAVNIVSFEERKGQKDRIEAEIVVERASQKGILIGKGGKALKKVGVAARLEIENFTGREVYLGLFVKVRADWRNSEVHLKSFGYGE